LRRLQHGDPFTARYAHELGAKAMATGPLRRLRAASGGRALYRAREEERDQSYFSWFGDAPAARTSCGFPLGDMTKAETREHARRFGLVVADKHDSQDICFVPTGRYTEHHRAAQARRRGRRRYRRSQRQGARRHDGIIHFTVGQRKGLKIADPRRSMWWRSMRRRVVVIVGPREALTMRQIALRDVNWIGEGALDGVLGEGRLKCSSRCARPVRRRRRGCRAPRMA